MSRTRPDYTIAVLDRALDVLEALADSESSIRASELARSIGSSKSAVYRIMSTLERRGYVGKDGETMRYRLGARLTYLGQRALEGLDLYDVARPLLEELSHQFNETVNLGVLVDCEISYIDMVESDHGLRMAAHLGGHDPAYSTSLGKAILAYLSPDVLTAHVPATLSPRTDRTITNTTRLRAELAQIRKLGYAEDCGENEEGAHCFGAPILDHTGYPIAAISVSAPDSRLDDVRSMEIAKAVRVTAGAISALMGGRQYEKSVAD